MSTKIATIVIGDVKTEDKVMKGLFFSELDEFHLTPCNDKKIPIKIWTTNHEEYDATEITADGDETIIHAINKDNTEKIFTLSTQKAIELLVCN